MATSLLMRGRKATRARGDSKYINETQTTAVENTNESIGEAPITSDPHAHEEPSSHNALAPTRTRTIGPNPPPTTENRQPRKPTLGEGVDPQAPRLGKPGGKGDVAPEDILKGQDNVLEAMQSRFTAAKRSPVWDRYVRKVEEEDKDLVEDWDRIIDVTLVFAALFSAISTGFVLESSKNLQPDQAKATVLAIQSLTSAIQAGTNNSTVPATGPSDDSFKPTLLTIWVNCLWFLSLGLSISVSLFAMLAKRWCYVFRSKRTGSSHERAIKRQKSWDAIEKWKIELVIEQLPTLMHIALMLFFFGLVVYLAEIHQPTMIVTAALVGLTIVLYIILTVLPLWYENCPMVTPFTRIMLATHWYLARGFKLILKQIWLQIESTSISSIAEQLSNWQELPGVIASILNQAFFSIKASLLGLQKQLVTFDGLKVPFLNQKENPSKESDWIIYGCADRTIGKTTPRPRPDESNWNMFNALTWILNNSTDRETVKEVLDHINSFPDVILDSFADSNQLHIVASTALEHLNRFQHDPAEWRDTLPINSPCARLVYLTMLPWLHKSTGFESKYDEIWKLAYKFRLFESRYMSPEEVDQWIATIKAKVTRLSEPGWWLEDLAGKMVLGCAPESGLKVCTTLGSALLSEELEVILRARHLEVEVYPTLCWIFLNNVINCTYGCWPHNDPEASEDLILVSSDSTLTLSHFRDSRKRQESRLWLAIVGITGIFYSFTRYPDPKDGPTADSNSRYFVRLISFLRTTLHNSVPVDMDSFLGDMPVYNDTEVRLYQFDSLHYGIDALSFVVDSSIYANCPLESELSALLHDLKAIRDFKASLIAKPGQEPDYGRALEAYQSKEWVNHLPGMLLTAGVLVSEPRQFHLCRERARLFANFLPDIIFGRSGLDQSIASSRSSECVGMMPTTDQLVAASDDIAACAWMPFPVQRSPAEWKTKYPNYTRRDLIWEPLENVGLLQASIDSFGVYRFFSDNCWTTESKEEPREAHRAVGYCLYIKAGLLNRLYSFSTVPDAHSPDVLTWSIALASHVVELLQFWDAATFGLEDQNLIISSLVRLTDTLLDALEHNASVRPTKSSQQPMTDIQRVSADRRDPQSQLEALVKAGVLPILARPFSPHSLPPATGIDEHNSDNSEWYDALVRTIERLARAFPRIRAERKFATAIDDALEAFGRAEWMFNQEIEASSGNGGDNRKTPRDDITEVDFYSDLVTYYEAKVLQNHEGSSPMLELVKRLRNDMETQHPPASPQVESPVDVRIDMPQGS